jgi:hypothetical protein
MANDRVPAGVQRIQVKIDPVHHDESQKDQYREAELPELTSNFQMFSHRAAESAKNAAANRVRDQPRRMRTLQLNWSLSLPKAQCDKVAG